MLELEMLTNINAVSGDEGRIRRVIEDKVAPYADSLTVDTMGNLIAFKKGRTNGGKKVIMSAHMDEVGFIVSEITDDGYIKFKSVGGIDDRIKLAQRVVIGDNCVKGVMGIKAVHLQSAEERKSVIKEKDMYIDIGARDADEAKTLVSLGDYIAFDSAYRELGGLIKAKALDDRVGCALLCELIKGNYENDIYFCFCVQEEVGVRGAAIVARRIKADVAIVLESTTASDTPGCAEHLYSSSLGEGPVISVMDTGSHSDRELNDFIVSIAKEKNIKFQFKKTSFGGNDARAYQTSSLPCKTAAISLACRYIHSPVSCADRGDMELMLKLSGEICKSIHKF